MSIKGTPRKREDAKASSPNTSKECLFLLGDIMQKCSTCKEVKPLFEFYRDRTRIKKRRTQCKGCWRITHKNCRAKNPQLYRKKAHKRYLKNKEKITFRKKMFYRLYPEKHIAHIKTANAIRKGELIRQPCEQCGKKNADAHHDNYYKPMKIKWLCDYCHMSLHHAKT